MWRATSATVVASAPRQVVCDAACDGWGIRPKLALKPGSPLNEPGMRVEPPPSLAVHIATIPEATAAADPPLDPPGVRSGFHGFRVTPRAGDAVKETAPNSGAAVLPSGMPPAARSRATCTESSATGGRPLKRSDP